MERESVWARFACTAAEVIYTRADAEKAFMGLAAVAGKQPTLKEAVIAKNYLDKKELRAMGQVEKWRLEPQHTVAFCSSTNMRQIKEIWNKNQGLTERKRLAFFNEINGRKETQGRPMPC